MRDAFEAALSALKGPQEAEEGLMAGEESNRGEQDMEEDSAGQPQRRKRPRGSVDRSSPPPAPAVSKGGTRSSPSGNSTAGQQEQQQQQQQRSYRQPRERQNHRFHSVGPVMEDPRFSLSHAREGPQGLLLGFNYWYPGLGGAGLITTSDLRQLILSTLQMSGPPEWVSPFALHSLQGERVSRVIVVHAYDLDVSKAQDELRTGSIPCLARWSRIPTRHSVRAGRLSRWGDLSPAPSLLLWQDIPPLCKRDAAKLPPEHLLRKCAVTFSACRQGPSPFTDDIQLFFEGDGPKQNKEMHLDSSKMPPADSVVCHGQFSRQRNGESGNWFLCREEGELVLHLDWYKSGKKDCLVFSTGEGKSSMLSGAAPSGGGGLESTTCQGSLDESATSRSKEEDEDESSTIVRFHTVALADGSDSTGKVDLKATQERLELTLVRAVPYLPRRAAAKQGINVVGTCSYKEQRYRDGAEMFSFYEDEVLDKGGLHSAGASTLVVDVDALDLEHYSLSREEKLSIGIPMDVDVEGEGFVYSRAARRELALVRAEGGHHMISEEDGEVDDEETRAEINRPGYPLLAIDCEMIQTLQGLEVARVSLVDPTGKVVLDRYIKPENPIYSLNTEFSGITEEDMKSATASLADVQKEVNSLVGPETFLVAHSIDSDLRALRLVHPLLIDTCALYPHPKGSPYKMSLKALCEGILGKEIQTGTGTTGHDSRADAWHSMQLALVKMAKGDGFEVPGPWAGCQQIPRETLWAVLSRSPGSSVRSLILSPKEEKPLPLWIRYSHLGYRQHADPMWLGNEWMTLLSPRPPVEEENKRKVEVVVRACAGVQECIAHALDALKGVSGDEGTGGGGGAPASPCPELLWIDLACGQGSEIGHKFVSSPFDAKSERSDAGVLASSRPFRDIDAAAEALYEAAPKGTLLLVVCQGNARLVGRLLEEKTKDRWGLRAKGNNLVIAGGRSGRDGGEWTKELDFVLGDATDRAMTGLTFAGVK